MRSVSSIPLVLAFVLLVLPISAAPIERIERGFASRVERAAAKRERLVVAPLVTSDGAAVSLELERFEIWAADAEIVIHDAAGRITRTRPPRTAYYRGTVNGERDSLAMVAVEPDGAIRGFIAAGEQRWLVQRGVAKRRDQQLQLDDPVLATELDEQSLRAEGNPWRCFLDKQTLTGDLSRLRANGAPRADAASAATISYSLRVAVETDTELFSQLGSSEKVTSYIADLAAKTSLIYQRDLQTTITLGELHVWTGSSDPWNAASDIYAAHTELATVWKAQYTGVKRSVVLMISGKNLGGGVAWLGGLCDTDYGYGVVSASGAFSTQVADPTTTINGVEYAMPVYSADFWMLEGFAHELGHLAGADHTHCMPLTNADRAKYNTSRAFIDECYSAENSCSTATPSVPPERGTIMSYCHLRNGFNDPYPPSRYLLTKPGEPSELLVPFFREQLATGAPAVVLQADPEAIACGATSTFTVAVPPAATIAWSVTNATPTSAANAASFSFISQAASVTLSVAVTSEQGCGITETRTYATTCGRPAAPAAVSAEASSSSTVSITWIAAPSATSYEISRRSAGTEAVVIGTSSTTSYTDLTAAPNSAYLYTVKTVDATNAKSVSSAADLATTVMFTDAALSPGMTVRRAHLTELRTAVAAVRALAGLAPATFTDATPSLIRAVHISELRAAVDAARASLQLPLITYADASIQPGSTPVRATHLLQLRDGVR